MPPQGTILANLDSDEFNDLTGRDFTFPPTNSENAATISLSPKSGGIFRSQSARIGGGGVGGSNQTSFAKLKDGGSSGGGGGGMPHQTPQLKRYNTPMVKANVDVNMFEVGLKIDVCDSSFFWYAAKVIGISPQHGIKVSYDGFDDKWNEWISVDEMGFRVAPYSSRAIGGKESGGINVFSATKYGRSKRGEQIREKSNV